MNDRKGGEGYFPHLLFARRKFEYAVLIRVNLADKLVSISEGNKLVHIVETRSQIQPAELVESAVSHAFQAVGSHQTPALPLDLGSTSDGKTLFIVFVGHAHCLRPTAELHQSMYNNILTRPIARRLDQTWLRTEAFNRKDLANALASGETSGFRSSYHQYTVNSGAYWWYNVYARTAGTISTPILRS